MNLRTAAMPANLLRLGAGALGLAAVGVLLVQGSEAAFTADTTNTGNSVVAGTVALSDSDGSGLDGKGTGTAMFNVGNLNGGQTITRCINVAYNGTLTADVKLFGTGIGDLAPGLKTTIEAGTGAAGGANFSCAGFDQATATTIFPVDSSKNTLANFGADHNTTNGSGLTGYANAIKNSSRSYKITMVVSSNNDYQGKTASASFTWVATGQDVATGNMVNGANT